MIENEQKLRVVRERKFELFKRDPLSIELDELFRKTRSSPDTKFIHSERLGEIEKLLQSKWNCYLKLNSNHKIPSTEPFHWLDFHSNHLSVIDLRKYIK